MDQSDAFVHLVVQAIIYGVIGLATLTVVVFLWLQVAGARRALTEGEASFGNHIQAGLLFGVVALLALIGLKVGPSGWLFFIVFWLVGIVLCWDRIFLTGNVLVDSALPGVVFGLIGSFVASGIGAVFSGGVGFGVFSTLLILIVSGAVVARIVGWLNN